MCQGSNLLKPLPRSCQQKSKCKGQCTMLHSLFRPGVNSESFPQCIMYMRYSFSMVRKVGQCAVHTKIVVHKHYSSYYHAFVEVAYPECSMSSN